MIEGTNGNRNAAILSRLREVLEKEEGSLLVRQHFDKLDDSLVAALRAEGERLAEEGDELGAEEYRAWADEARSLVTWERIFSTKVSSREEAKAVLEEIRDRLDDAFVELCVEILAMPVGQLNGMLQEVLSSRDTVDKSEVLERAHELVASARRNLEVLELVGTVTDQPTHLIQGLLQKGTLLMLQSQLEAELGEEEMAEETGKEARLALTLSATFDNVPALLRAKARGNLAVLAGRARPEEVETHQRAAQELAEEAGDREMLRTVRRDRAYWAKERGDQAAALELYEGNIEDTERILFEPGSPILWAEEVADTWPDYAGAVEACLALGADDPAYFERALEVAEKGKARAFTQSLATITGGRRGAPSRLVRRRESIIQQMMTLGIPLGELPEEIAKKRHHKFEVAQRRLGIVEAQLDTYTTGRALNLQCLPGSFRKMVPLVPAGGAILSYFSLPDRVILFVLDEEGLAVPPVEIPLSEQDLARVMVNINLTLHIRGDYQTYAQLQRQLERRMEEFWPDHNLRFLYGKLIAPVEEVIDGKSPLYIVPHGGLRDLPFHALIGSEGEALVDRAAVAYAPNLAVLRRSEGTGRGEITNCCAAGVGPEYGGPSTAGEEAAAVARLFGTDPHPASREALLPAMPKADLVHLACHSNSGSVFTGFQGLALADGVLRQQEIAGLDLRASLVCLSACETASADQLPRPGNEMSGLVGAFFRAGAPAVVASSWPLSDRVARPFFEIFYGGLRRGESKAEALRQAQRAIKAERRFSHPYFWAPLWLWGAT